MELYEHSPQRGFIKKLQCIDPFTYWVQCKSCLDLRIINEKLKRIVFSEKDYSVDKAYTPENDEFVIVQDIDGLFYRGSVLSCLKEGYYTVLLLDKYGTLTVGEDEIYFLPSPWKYIKEQGHVIRIYGVLPSPQLDLNVVKKWESCLNKALSGASDVRLEDCCEIADFMFGSIVLLDGLKVLGLDEILLEQQFAVPSLAFEEDIIASWEYKKKIDFEKLKCGGTISSPSFLGTEENICKDTSNLSKIGGNNDIKISPQQTLFLKALIEGFILSPESLLHPKAFNKINLTRKIMDNCKRQHSESTEVSNPSEKSPDLIFKNNFHASNKEHILKPISPVHPSELYTRPEMLTRTCHNDFAGTLSNECTPSKKNSKNIFYRTANNELNPNVSTFKKSPKSKDNECDSHDTGIENRNDLSYFRPAKYEDLDLKNEMYGFKYNSSDKSSCSSFDNKIGVTDQINNFCGRQNRTKNKESHIDVDNSDVTDCSSNKLSEKKSRPPKKQKKKIRKEKLSEKISENKVHQEARIHLSSDMFLSDEAFYSADNRISHNAEYEARMCRKEQSLKSLKEHHYSYSTESQNVKTTRGSYQEDTSYSSSCTNFNRPDNSCSLEKCSKNYSKNKAVKRSNDMSNVYGCQKNDNYHDEVERYKPGNDMYHSSAHNSNRNLEGRNTETFQSTNHHSNRINKSSNKQTSRSKLKNRIGDKTDDEKLSEKFVRTTKELSESPNSKIGNRNSCETDPDYHSWSNLRDLDDNQQVHKLSGTSSESREHLSNKPGLQKNILKDTRKERCSEKCTSTPKQNFEKKCAPEVEISPIHKKHSSNENSTDEKFDSFHSVYDNKESFVWKNSHQNSLYEDSGDHSLEKNKKMPNILTDVTVSAIASEVNASKTSNLSLKAEVSKTSNEPEHFAMSGGMGRGKLLQIYFESRSNNGQTEKSVNDLQNSTNSEPFVSCIEYPIDLSTNMEGTDESKCIKKEKLKSESEEEIVCSETNVKHDFTESQEDSANYITNDHEDRYYDIEPPKLLTFPIDETSLYASDNLKKELTKKSNPEDVYENLLNVASEHKPIDSSALVNSDQMCTLKLEREILREYSIGELTERMKFLCGIIHGNIKSQPISNISELKLNDHIFANIAAKKMKDLTRSQMCAIPVLLQRRNLILVGPPNSGKTLAYVISIMSLLLEEDYYKTIKKGNGPRCVFVTSSSQNANYVSQFCSAMCGAKLTIITTYGGGLELERKVELTNGCEVLVTTPKCWLRLLQHTSVTNLFRLCHIVFDDADTLFDTFLPDVQEIMNQTKKMLLIRRRECPLGLHIAVIGEKWTPILEEVLKVIESPVLCISSYLEAAFYARVKPTTYILPPGAKIEKLKDLLHSNSQKVRTVIVCQSAAEVKTLRSVVDLSLSDDVLVAHEDMSLTLLCEVSAKWARSTSPPTLLCSDFVLGEVAVTNAQRLIHFSLPESKAYFSERFATIKENFYDRIKYPKSAPPDCQVDILVDNSNEQQFPEIVNFMKRLSTPIPKEVMDTVKKINIHREERKSDMMFCKRMLMFGRCWKIDRCKRRHVFNTSKGNEFSQLPQCGMVKVKILHVHNPSHYSVRIIATKTNENDSWINKKSNFFLLGLKMSNYYSHRENRIPHGRVNVGDIVAVQVESDLLFGRGKVIDIISRDEKLNPVLVNVHLIDKGSIQKYKAIDLFYLPPELQNFEQESYDLYLTGLQPIDFDNEWSFAAIYRLKKSIESLSVNEEDQFFVAKIILTAEANMIATSLLCYEWLTLNKCFIVRFSPRKFILDTGFAESNGSHVRTILNLAIEAGIISSYPESLNEVEEEESKEIAEIQWAHFEKDKYFLTSVISSVNPSLFYLKIDKFSDRLSILQKELTDLLNNKIIKPDIIRTDMLCAVKNPMDNEWNRAILLEVIDDLQMEVFCVDYGDIITVPFSDFSLLPKGFASRLPFQAVECSLVGIVPLDEDWTPEAVQFFYLLTGDEDNIQRPLYAKVCEVKPKAETTGGRHYQVVLVDTREDQDTFLNKELVYKGYANWDPITKVYLTDTTVLSPNCQNVNDDCKEDSAEECEDTDNAYRDNEEIWTDEMCLKTEEDCPKKNTKTRNKDTTVLNNFLKTIMDGDFDIEFTTRGLIENTFFPQNQFALERGLPCSSDSGAQNTKVENTDGAEEKSILTEETGSIKNAEDKTNMSENYSHIPESPKSEIDDESSNETMFDQDTSYATPLTKVFDRIFYPPVLWSQNDYHIKLRVNVPDIIEYQLDCSEFEMRFQAVIEQKYYWLDLEFFGPICCDSVEYSSKGQYFEIKVEKYIKGELWPRLTYQDIKHSWIKLDPDFIFKKDDESLAATLIKRGEKLSRCKEALHSKRPTLEYMAAYQGPDIDSDLESEDSGTSDAEEYYDLRETEETAGDH